MIRIGIVDLDTSHGDSFAKQIAGMEGAQLVAALDHLDVRDDAWVDAWCGQHACRRCADVAAMLAAGVDAVAILSVNWDAHLERARPYLEAGIPVFVDKPLAGGAAGVRAFQELVAKTGTAFFEGSGWRWNAAIREAREQLAGSRIDCVLAAAPNQYFYYGIHAPELVLGLLGPGMKEVRMVRHDAKGTVIHFEHERGARGYMQPQSPYAFRAVSFVADGAFRTVEFPIPEIHRAVVETLVRTAREKRSPLPVEQIGESVRILAAAMESHRNGGAPVRVAEVSDAVAFDGAAFIEEYRKEKA